MTFDWNKRPDRGYKINRRFALFPCRMSGSNYIWLEMYYSLRTHHSFNLGGSISNYWFKREGSKSMFSFRPFLKKNHYFKNKLKEKRQEEINIVNWKKLSNLYKK